MKIKADYEMTFSLDEIIVMADDNVSYGSGRFAKKWLDEIENNSTDFVHFIAQAIDEYDKSVPVDIDKQVAITDDDMNTMYAWRESDWVFDGVLENYPKMTRDEEGKIPYTVKGDSVIVKMSVGIDVDMFKYKLDMEYRERRKNERRNKMNSNACNKITLDMLKPGSEYGEIVLIPNDDAFIYTDDEKAINAEYECWFDVDKVFGTDTKGRDDRTVDFYTDYYPEDGRMTATVTVKDSNGGDTDYNYDLSDKEKEFLLDMMEKEAKREGYESLVDMWQKETEHDNPEMEKY